ncbi:MAG: c-type cytochrome [Acidobacteriota bacterium]
MAKRFFILVGVVSLFFLNGMTARADDPPGVKLYATYCGACHGGAGKGGFAPAIGSGEYMSAKDDATIAQITGEGKAGSGMPAWSKSKGGMLTEDQIRDIVAYLRSLAPSPSATAPVTAETTSAPVPKDSVQTKMTLVQAASSNGKPVLDVTLKEDNGNPVGGAAIAFARDTMFGAVDLGTAKTDAAGHVSFVVDDLPRQAREMIASFKGDKGWVSSEAKIVVGLPMEASAQDVDLRQVRLDIEEPLLSPDGSLITPNPPLLPVTLFLLVVGGVWSIYGYVLYQIYRILRAGAR